MNGSAFKNNRQLLTALALMGICTALVLGGEQATDLWKRGVAAFSKGDYQAAVVHFKVAQEANYDKPSTLYYLGLSLYQVGRYDEALAALKESGAIEPDFRDYIYHYHVGAIYYRKKLYTLAAEEMREVLANNPESVIVSKAQEVLSAAKSLPKPLPKESMEWYVSAGAKGLDEGNVSWAEDYALEAVRNMPNDGSAQVIMARVRMAQGRQKDALECLKNTNNSEVLLLRGKLLLGLGEVGQAVDDLLKASDDRPVEVQARLLEIARVAKQTGDSGTLLRIMQEMKTRWPNAPETATVRAIFEEQR